ncbi:hypothetical protein C8J57DRAFT_1579344 [Mycena rebaudengoi]|nr:hypothetical protein C8J57DRAFT_1579344 [Mycena rebaudengoi]
MNVQVQYKFGSQTLHSKLTLLLHFHGKRKKDRKTLPDDGATYRPRLDAEKQAVNRHKASADHYKRNTAQIREKQRIQMAERRAAAKLAKRHWDPPKHTKTLEAYISTDVDACGVGNEVSGPEIFAGPSSVRVNSIPFGLLDPMNESSSDKSLAAVANFLEEQPSLSSMSMAEAPNIVARPNSPTPDERIAVEVLASMALFQAEPLLQNNNTDSVLSLAAMLNSLSSSLNVQQPAQRVGDSTQEIAVALNAGHPPEPPTTLERRHWLESGHERVEPGAWMTDRSAADVQLWCNVVDLYRSSREEGNISQAHFQDSDSFRNEQQFYEYYN